MTGTRPATVSTHLGEQQRAWARPRCGRRPRRPARARRRRPSPAPSRRGGRRRSTGSRRTPPAWSRSISSGLGAWAKDATVTCRSDEQVAAAGGVGVVGPQVDAEGGVGGGLHLVDGGDQLLIGHGGRRQDAEGAGPAPWPPPGRARPPSPCPSARWGRRRPPARTAACGGAFTSQSTAGRGAPAGSSTSRSRRSCSCVGAGVVGHVVGDRQLEPAGGDHLVDGHAGVDRAQAHRVVGGGEVEHGQVGDDPADLVAARTASGRSAARS